MAGLILDGKLYSREPEKLPQYMSELLYSCPTVADFTGHPSVKQVEAAYQWSKDLKANGGRLLITPTIRVELVSAPKVKFTVNRDW